MTSVCSALRLQWRLFYHDTSDLQVQVTDLAGGSGLAAGIVSVTRDLKGNELPLTVKFKWR